MTDYTPLHHVIHTPPSIVGGGRRGGHGWRVKLWHRRPPYKGVQASGMWVYTDRLQFPNHKVRKIIPIIGRIYSFIGQTLRLGYVPGTIKDAEIHSQVKSRVRQRGCMML